MAFEEPASQTFLTIYQTSRRPYGSLGLLQKLSLGSKVYGGGFVHVLIDRENYEIALRRVHSPGRNIARVTKGRFQQWFFIDMPFGRYTYLREQMLPSIDGMEHKYIVLGLTDSVESRATSSLARGEFSMDPKKPPTSNFIYPGGEEEGKDV